MPVMMPPTTARMATNEATTARARGHERSVSQRTSGEMAAARMTAIRTGMMTSGTRVAVQMIAHARAATVRAWTDRMLARPSPSDHMAAIPVWGSVIGLSLSQR